MDIVRAFRYAIRIMADGKNQKELQCAAPNGIETNGNMIYLPECCPYRDKSNVRRKYVKCPSASSIN